MTSKPELSADEMAAEAVTALPDREAMSLLDLDVNLDLALDLREPLIGGRVTLRDVLADPVLRGAARHQQQRRRQQDAQLRHLSHMPPPPL